MAVVIEEMESVVEGEPSRGQASGGGGDGGEKRAKAPDIGMELRRIEVRKARLRAD
jgi:hypothetical protein